MSQEILMPELSPTMTSGVLSRWCVRVGDKIEVGDIIAEIETDKVTVEFESTHAGVIKQLLVAEGTTDVAVGSSIACLSTEHDVIVLSDDSNTSPKLNEKPALTQPPAIKSQPRKHTEPLTDKIVLNATPADRLITEIKSDIRISPIARRMAYQAGVDLTTIKGTGERGRINKEDIRSALGINNHVDCSVEQFAGKLTAHQFDVTYELLPEFIEMPLSGMRKAVAKRLTESSQYIPHFYMTVDCCLEKLLSLRQQINQAATDRPKLTVNDFVIKSVALALKQTPDANVMWDKDKILQFSDVDISIAVSIDGGLITPVIKSCAGKGLRSISEYCSNLVKKAKSGRLKPSEYQGGTFTISNLGMFGIREFTSIINPPQSGILSVGAGEKRAVVEGDEIVVKTQMTITLAMDHRCVDGVTGAKLINQIKWNIENPLELVL